MARVFASKQGVTIFSYGYSVGVPYEELDDLIRQLTTLRSQRRPD